MRYVFRNDASAMTFLVEQSSALAPICNASTHAYPPRRMQITEHLGDGALRERVPEEVEQQFL